MPAPTIDLIGHTIGAGRLRFIEKLGGGTYGSIYRATVQHSVKSSRDSPSQYAVKVLTKVDCKTVEALYQNREIAMHKAASAHPNVLTLHDILEDEKHIYLVLDYCSGGDLYNAVAERQSFHKNDALIKDVFVQILDAVQACHDKGIYHRDLKPDNIFISGDDSKIFIGDFGLATNIKLSTSFSCGSSFYMSPECLGEEFNYAPFSTPKSDIWSLGVILVNMITMRNPWKKATTEDSNFCRYLSDKRFFTKALPVSEEVADLLTKIFTFNAYPRITIPQIRERILTIETFYRMKEDDTSAKENVQDPVVAVDAPKVVWTGTDPGVHTPESEISDEEYLFASPCASAPIPCIVPHKPLCIFPPQPHCITPARPPPTRPATPIDVEDTVPAGAAFSSSSSEGSSAPVTPAYTMALDVVEGTKKKGSTERRFRIVTPSRFSIQYAVTSLIKSSVHDMMSNTDS